jgi:3-dehydroquinate dehydratase-2
MRKVLVLNGPNLNLLGKREPEIYGRIDLVQIKADLEDISLNQVEIDLRQTNSEAELIEWIHEAFSQKLDVILNPAAFTHYSYALRDACSALSANGQKLIEVHISNPHAREEFRHTSVISAVASGVIAGFGAQSYALALKALIDN